MINYTFGPAPEGMQPLIDAAAFDPAFAQSLYDVRATGHYSSINLNGLETPEHPEILVATQHVFWDSEHDRLRGQGMIVIKDPLAQQVLARAYQNNGLELSLNPDRTEAEETIQKIRNVLNLGGLATFAAWDFVKTTEEGPGYLSINYPRLLIGLDGEPELARAKSILDVPREDLDYSAGVALIASGIAFHDNVRHE